MKHAAIIGLVALAMGAATVSAAPAGHPEVIASVRAALADTLRDYPSARFRDVHMQTEDPWTLCGYINARNGMGGFTGWSRFFGMRLNSRGDGFVMIADDDAKMTAVSAACDDPKTHWSGADYSGRLLSR